MRKRLCAGFALALAVLFAGAMREARAADPAFCRKYAEAALNQVRGGLSNPRGAVGMQGARWSSDFAVHHQWCLGVSFLDAGTERDARTNYLRACR